MTLGKIEVPVVVPYGRSSEIEGEVEIEIELADVIKLLKELDPESRRVVMKKLVELFGDGRD